VFKVTFNRKGPQCVAARSFPEGWEYDHRLASLKGDQRGGKLKCLYRKAGLAEKSGGQADAGQGCQQKQNVV